MFSTITDFLVISCPICHTRIQVQNTQFVDDLPSNLYIDTLLAMVGINEGKEKKVETPPITPNNMQSVELFAAGVRCTHCKTMCDNVDVTYCQHCKLVCPN